MSLFIIIINKKMLSNYCEDINKSWRGKVIPEYMLIRSTTDPLSEVVLCSIPQLFSLRNFTLYVEMLDGRKIPLKIKEEFKQYIDGIYKENLPSKI
jgi:hypothetical protein